MEHMLSAAPCVGTSSLFSKFATAGNVVECVIVRRSSCVANTVVAHTGGLAAHSCSVLNLAEISTALVIASGLLDGCDARVRGWCTSVVVQDLDVLVAEITPSETLWCRTFDNNGSVAEGLPAGTVRA